MEKILVVEDELIVARDIKKTLERNGYKVIGVARSTDKALQMIEEGRPTLVLVDIFLKGSLTGIDLAKELNKLAIPFIYISANSNKPVLEAAKSTNPFGFIVKPFREKDLLVTMEIARYRFESSKQYGIPGIDVRNDFKTHKINLNEKAFENIIGQSAAMLHVFQLIEQVAPFDTSVLITGETGTGKEGVASAIHLLSKRNKKPYVKVNCAAIPENLMETEFFGYEKGAFTGAYSSTPGKFEMANGGTLLLDEIGEIPMEMQAKLLRVLQEKEVQRVGSHLTIKTDVRIIASTNKNLEEEVAAGRFRLDLYYRLQVFPIALPPLRESKEDIPRLVSYFIKYFNLRMDKQIQGIHERIMNELMDYNWPGNIRQLQHVLERSVLISTEGKIDHIQLPAQTFPKPELMIHDADQEMVQEKMRLLTALKSSNFKVSGVNGAAVKLNITPAIVYGLIKKHGISKTFEVD
jgi:DNA-binding NtrC family response regulator